MHILIVLAAFAVTAVTPFLSAQPRANGDVVAPLYDNAGATEAEDDKSERR